MQVQAPGATRPFEGQAVLPAGARISFPALAAKAVVVHTVTYFAMGLLALNLLEYRTAFEAPVTREFMRPVTDPLVALGPSLQFVRGILFAIAFYPLRDVLFGRRNGWLTMWLLLVVLGILAPFGAAPGSVEGLLYTKLPIGVQVSGWLEIVTQALLLSFVLHHWINHPARRWIAWVLGTMYVLAVTLSVLGFAMAAR